MPGSHSAKAPRGVTALVRWPEDRRQQRLVANGDRADPAGFGRVAVADDRPVRPVIQPAGAALLAEESMVDRVRDAEDLAIHGVDRVRQRAMPVAARLAGDILEGDRDDARRERPEGIRRLGQPDQVQQRDARDDSCGSVQRVADGLGAIGGRGSERRLPVVRRDPRQEGPADARTLELGPDEQHREEPQPFAHQRCREGHDPLLAGPVRGQRCDDEPFGIR